VHLYLLTNAYVDLLISVVLAFIMFGIGLSLTPQNFIDHLKHPKSILIGLFAQLILLPAIAFAISLESGLSPEIKVGLMILAACPGGTTSGFITYFFKGDVALSVSLTAINSFLSLVSIPVVTNLSLLYFMGAASTIQLPILKTAAQIFCVTVIPASIGVWVRVRKEALSLRIQRPLKTIMVILLALVFIIKFFADKNEGGTGITYAETFQLLPSTLLINILGFILGYLSGTIPKMGTSKSFTIGIEVAMHNTTLAFLVAGTLLQNQEMVKPSLIYSMFSFWTALLFGYFIKWIFKKHFTISPGS
jgi:bile acid:Na+ symporter, BASS family